MIFQPHSELGQDVVAQGVAELQDLRDWGQREKFSLILCRRQKRRAAPRPGALTPGHPSRVLSGCTDRWSQAGKVMATRAKWVGSRKQILLHRREAQKLPAPPALARPCLPKEAARSHSAGHGHPRPHLLWACAEVTQKSWEGPLL